ncbi:unnamed protein product [Allacma fusca]|uniref:Uncharacterized protein n=1 Tax=Allacma fusca TaxID=39272 RepID=A0A8J2L290_9HEXA|nr:unnamed protein product [Allacma fusca]
MELKTEFVARELFLDLLRKHDRNFVLENMYLDFISDHFGFLNDEINYFRQRRKLYTWRKHDDLLGLFKLRNWRNGLLQRENKHVFKSIPIPTFTL